MSAQQQRRLDRFAFLARAISFVFALTTERVELRQASEVFRHIGVRYELHFAKAFDPRLVAWRERLACFEFCEALVEIFQRGLYIAIAPLHREFARTRWRQTMQAHIEIEQLKVRRRQHALQALRGALQRQLVFPATLEIALMTDRGRLHQIVLREISERRFRRELSVHHEYLLDQRLGPGARRQDHLRRIGMFEHALRQHDLVSQQTLIGRQWRGASRAAALKLSQPPARFGNNRVHRIVSWSPQTLSVPSRYLPPFSHRRHSLLRPAKPP